MAALNSSAAVAVVGAGAMGAGIAQVAAQAGHPVWLFDLKPGAAQQAIEAMRETFAKLAAKGRMSADAASAAGARVQVAQGLADFAHAALVVEAIVERLDVKRSLFADLEALVGDDCVLATNTSSISVTAIAAGLRRPGRVLGMHFFNPAPLMALVEVVSGLATDPALAQAIHDTALSWGKSPVHTKSTPGFIVNRVARPYYGEGLRLLGEQAGDAATIDAVMREAGGFRMGPFELMDLIGHDVNYAVSRSVFDAYYGDPRFAPSLIQLELVNAGHLGRKSGRGFYDYAAGAVKPQPATEAAATLAVPISVSTASAFGAALAARLQSAGVACERRDAGPLLQAGTARVEITDGRSATQRGADAAHGGHADLVVVDLVLDAANAKRIAIAASERCSATALTAATAALQAAGYAVTRFADVPGLAVMRTVAMLANEAADAVYQGVCDAAAADIAMCKGVNYPRGPLSWADAIGLPALLTVLDNLARSYGEPRYRASPLLRRLVAAGRGFHAAN
ncbi:MAG: 3-hydroxyacyl-CoA dehydrogenase [Burkholderiales bacterium]|nr:3-hydroxyacyl-CoA dehydrogenase [Burkholderiales bacterium]MDE1925724.1 3-hydroxyacyl-CoA dehydrogenase [Burkholderiales bacterium]MDE2157863.1 3-hydroxyacyl-CoA dehydrogenase [Burkholderiales bacterium]MDE2502560.1 3-hydroxyacyl-CoA dehydrogenase [Burkholderiales bacterium]